MPAVVTLRRLCAAMLAVTLAGAAPLPTIYNAPAGSRIAGAPDPSNPYDIVLPNGRIVAPVGKSVVVGMNALGVTLSPDGRYAIVSNDDERESSAVSTIVPGVRGGYSLTVVNTATMRVTDVFHGANEPFFIGLAALKDPADPSNTLVLAAGGPGNTVHFLQLDAYGR